MSNLNQFIVVVSTMAVLAGSGDRLEAESRVAITPPATELAFDAAFVKDRDIHFQMPKGVVLGAINRVVVDSMGNLIILDSSQNTVFQTDAEGNYLRQIGARGGAEGEYFHVFKLLLASNGDLYIHSAGANLKYLVFSGDSYVFKREVPDPNFSSGLIDHVVFTEGGNMYASQVDSDHALFRFDDDFNKTDSLYPVEDQRTAVALHRFHSTILTPNTGGGFYFMYPTAYKIHQYSELGELERTLFSDYRSKYRDGIKPLPAALDPKDWNPKHDEWIAEHLIRFGLFECGPDLLVLAQYRSEVSGEYKFYLNILHKDGHSVADGIRVPAGHGLLTTNGSELYFVVEGEFDEVTGKTSDPHLAVYRINDL